MIVTIYRTCKIDIQNRRKMDILKVIFIFVHILSAWMTRRKLNRSAVTETVKFMNRKPVIVCLTKTARKAEQHKCKN